MPAGVPAYPGDAPQEHSSDEYEAGPAPAFSRTGRATRYDGQHARSRQAAAFRAVRTRLYSKAALQSVIN